MLVLSRRVGEQIVIEGQIRIVVTAVRGERVRLGISAPATVRIDRKEVHDRRSPEPRSPGSDVREVCRLQEDGSRR